MGSWSELDHTADVGLRVEGADLGDLFATTVLGMFALIGTAEFAAGDTRTFEISVEAEGPEERLRNLLRRVLAEFDRDGFFPVNVRVRDDGRTAKATAVGGRFDPLRHEFHTEIKG